MILAINPGSTSTKVAIYKDYEIVFEQTLRHDTEKIEQYACVADQMEWRTSLISDMLKEHNIEPKDLRAVVGRGGLTKPIESGTYEVNDLLYNDTRNAKREHASNLGALIARQIADIATQQSGVEVKAYIHDPVVVDEMCDLARISGHPLFPRTSAFHALNSKATAKRHARSVGRKYEEMNFIVAHMGGGVSVSAHQKGRVVDVTNAISGEGCFSPERAGRIEPMAIVNTCFSGEYTRSEVAKMLVGGGGIVAHLGINSMSDVMTMFREGEPKATTIVNAFCYNVAKDIAMMASVLCGKVDAIILTGGIAYNQEIIDGVNHYIDWIVPISPYPGEDELEALARSVQEVVDGESESKEYV